MRKQWYGDSRDYVKWSCIRQEAKSGLTVLYGVMLRPDSFDDPLLDPEVVSFFDGLKDFSALRRIFPHGFVVEDSFYETKNADRYFDRLLKKMAEIHSNGSNVLVFLDPDTGLEPKSGSKEEHLRAEDIRKVCLGLNPGDKLIFYQHATRAANWIDSFQRRLDEICGVIGMTQGHAFHARGIAKDVCFFILTKACVR